MPLDERPCGCVYDQASARLLAICFAHVQAEEAALTAAERAAAQPLGEPVQTAGKAPA